MAAACHGTPFGLPVHNNGRAIALYTASGMHKPTFNDFQEIQTHMKKHEPRNMKIVWKSCNIHMKLMWDVKSHHFHMCLIWSSYFLHILEPGRAWGGWAQIHTSGGLFGCKGMMSLGLQGKEAEHFIVNSQASHRQTLHDLTWPRPLWLLQKWHIWYQI